MVTQNITIQKISPEGAAARQDVVALEAQYQVELRGERVFSFTCTPSHLEEMTTGALFSRGYLTSARQIDSIQTVGSRIRVALAETGPEGTPDALCPALDPETIFRTVNAIFRDPDTLFNRTGCAHSCSLFQEGKILCTFEDIGRHNALDKAIGYALRNGIPMKGCAVFTSGRISGDYMAKLIRAGFPIAVSRAAVTSEAVRLAKENGVVLYGFVRGNTANLYTE